MPRLQTLLLPLLAVLSTLMLGACSILTTAPTDPPLSGAAVASAIGHVRPSKADTCETQVQIAAQSSRIATFQAGKETVYKADQRCAAPTAKPVASAPVAGRQQQAAPRASPASLPPFDLELEPLLPPREPAWRERTVTAAAD